MKMIENPNHKKKDAVQTILTNEWFDELPYIEGKIELPESDVDYFYCATKLCSEFPFINKRSATYESEDLTKDVLDSLLGVQANLRHDKFNKVVGTIIGYDKVDGGIEIAVRIDREQASFHGLDPEDMKRGNMFSTVSLEVSKDAEKSFFYVIDDQYNILKKIPRLQGEKMGIRRTLDSDPTPYYYQGHRVVERIKPLRFTGVGFVPNPADVQAQVYAVTASETDDERLKLMAKPAVELAAVTHYPSPVASPPQPEESYHEPRQVSLEDHEYPDHLDIHEEDASACYEAMAAGNPDSAKKPYGDVKYGDSGYRGGIKRYPLNTPSHVRAAASYFGMPKNREKYSPEQSAHIQGAISAAKKRFDIGEPTEQASAGAVALEIPHMNESEIAAFRQKIADLETTLTSLRSEKEAASAEGTTAKSRVTQLEAELASVTAERDQLKSEKETAAREKQLDDIVAALEAIKASPDDAAKLALREKASAMIGEPAQLEILKLSRQVEALTEKASAPVTPAVTPTAPVVPSKEVFSATTPTAPITPQIESKPAAKNFAVEGFSVEDTIKYF